MDKQSTQHARKLQAVAAAIPKSYGLTDQLLCFTSPAGEPHTVIEQRGETKEADTILIVSGSVPRGPIYRSTNVQQVLTYIQSL